MCAESFQPCPTLGPMSNPMAHSPQDSSVHGILQARILEWAAMPFSSPGQYPAEIMILSQKVNNGKQISLFQTSTFSTSLCIPVTQMLVQMQLLIQLILPGESRDFAFLTRSWMMLMRLVLDCGHSMSKSGCFRVLYIVFSISYYLCMTF